MRTLNQLMGGTVLSLALLAGALTPAYADKISAGGKNPPLATTTAADSAAIDFGDDSGEWTKDGECDDPRFSGTGSADELVDADLFKDATDCKAAYDAGTVTFNGADTTGTAPSDIAIATPIDAIDWGDDSSKWAKDGECDDPRFAGAASAAELVEADLRKDATDCRAAYAAGTVTLKDASAAPTVGYAPPTDPAGIAIASPIDAIDFGDDSSEYARDGECDDPRFMGSAMGAEPLLSNTRKDATDCRAAYEAGSVTLNDAPPQSPQAQTPPTAPPAQQTPPTVPATPADADYGDDTSKWAKDGECDDPRFAGTGVAGELLEEDRGHDATDCRASVEAGTATWIGEAQATPPAIAPFDYGSDVSKWAKDGECDDMRFIGTGVDKKLLSEDTSADATDCKAAVEAGTATIRKVYTPEYAAGAPYDSSAIDFGDNTSDYADDTVCDDPRFEGPGVAGYVLDDDLKRDSVDCKAAYESGQIVLIEPATDS